MIYRKITLLCIFVFSQYSFSQILTHYYEKENVPDSIHEKMERTKSPIINIQPPSDIGEQLKTRSLRTQNSIEAPYQFGIGIDVFYCLENGSWTEVENGRIWSVKFFSEGAKSLNFVFNALSLPPGGNMEIINKDGTVVFGPVTPKSIPDNRTFRSNIIKGDEVTIYLFEPKEHRGESSITISRVIYGYRENFGDNSDRSLVSSSECNIDVACKPTYLEYSKAIARVLTDSSTFSAALIMSTDYSFKPYLLTSFHCVDTDSNGVLSLAEKAAVNDWIIQFQFKRKNCGQTTLSNVINYYGAIFRAAWQPTDFALVEINDSNQDPLENYDLMWLGWDRTGNVPTGGACLHHPLGDVMKISISEDAFISTKYDNQGSENHWKVSFNQGVIEGGSSGSPILNQNHRVVGQYHGGPQKDDACQQTVAKYGKFNLSWTGGGTNDTRLSNWLDPMSTNRTTINSSSSVIISGTNMLCSQGTYTISNMPSDSFVALNTNYSSTGLSIQVSPNLNITSYSNGSLTVQKVSDGRGYIKVYYKGSLISTKEMWVGGPVITDLYYDGNYIYSETDYMSQAVEDYYWIINGVTYHSIEGRKRLNLPYGTYNVEAYAYNSCGRGPSKYTQIVVGSGGYYSLGGVSSDHQVTIVPVDYSGAPQPLEVLQAKNDVNEKTLTVPYTLQNAQSGEVSGRGEMPVGGGVLDFSRVRSGLYVLTLTPQGRKPETFKVSFK